MSAPTTGCEEALRLLASYIDGELAGGDRIDLERHLQTCRSCYSRAEFEKRLKTQLGELRRRPVNPAFEERIRRLIRRFEPAS
jgi:anti-sigma factor RsiW